MKKTTFRFASTLVPLLAAASAAFAATPATTPAGESLSAATAAAASPAATAAAAVSAAPAIPGLGAPLVCKLDWNISTPVVADLDGDGRNDLLVLNNDTGRVEILYQRRPGEPAPARKTVRPDRWTPDLDNVPLRRESIAGDASMLGLAAADINGDGLPDILFTSARGGLHVVLQGPRAGEWRAPIKENASGSGRASGVGSLRVFPVFSAGASRGSPARAVAQQTDEGIAVRVFDGEAAKTLAAGRLPEPVLLRSTSGGRLFHAPLLAPANAGGRPAFARRALGTIRQVGDTEVLLTFRAINPGPAFGPETSLSVPVTDLDLSAQITPPETPAAPPAYAAINTRLKTVFAATFINDPAPLKTAPSAAIQSYAFPARANASDRGGDGDARGVTFFDADGDGLPDIVASDPAAAKLLVYRALPNGEYAPPAEYPTLPNLAALAPAPGAARTLLALNAKDGILATIQFTPTGAPGFPTIVPLPADLKPAVLATSEPAATNAAPFAVLLARNKSSDNVLYKVTAAAPAPSAPANAGPAEENAKKTKREKPAKADTHTAGPLQLTALAKVTETRRDVTALRLLDLNADGQPDILACVEREAPRFWVQAPDGTFAEAAANSPLRATLLDNLTPADISQATLDGKPALLATTPGFLRALRITPAGDLEILLQANARTPEDRLRAPLALDADTIVAWNTTTTALDWFERVKTPSAANASDATPAPASAAAADVWKIRSSTRLPAFDPRAARLQPAPGETTPRLLYTTPAAIVQIPTARRGLTVALAPIYENDLPGFTPNAHLTGSFLAAPARPNAPANARRAARAPRAQASVTLFDFSTHAIQVLHPAAAATGGTPASASPAVKSAPPAAVGAPPASLSAAPAAPWEDVLHFTLFDDNPHYRGRRDSGRQPRAAHIADLTGDSIGDLILLLHDRVLIYPGLPTK